MILWHMLLKRKRIEQRRLINATLAHHHRIPYQTDAY